MSKPKDLLAFRERQRLEGNRRMEATIGGDVLERTKTAAQAKGWPMGRVVEAALVDWLEREGA